HMAEVGAESRLHRGADITGKRCSCDTVNSSVAGCLLEQEHGIPHSCCGIRALLGTQASIGPGSGRIKLPMACGLIRSLDTTARRLTRHVISSRRESRARRQSPLYLL